jgi:prolycopene isomerase
VVVIGAGGGGLAAAAQLSHAGMDVVVLEQASRVGGSMVRFARGDYRFEASLHGYDGAGLRWLDTLGIEDELQLVRGETMYRAVFPDFTLDVPADLDEYRAKLVEMFPGYEANLTRLFADIAAMNFVPFSHLSTTEVLDSYGIDDPILRAVLTQQVGYGSGTTDSLPGALFAGLFASFHVFGFYYFVGGSQSISDALARVILENGGVIKTYTRATKVVVQNGTATHVRSNDGGCFQAKWLILNSNGPETYFTLLGEEYLGEELKEEIESRSIAFPVSPLDGRFLGRRRGPIGRSGLGYYGCQHRARADPTLVHRSRRGLSVEQRARKPEGPAGE